MSRSKLSIAHRLSPVACLAASWLFASSHSLSSGDLLLLSQIGTFVALAEAFHGLGLSASGEWQTGGEFMRKLLLTADVDGGAPPGVRLGLPEHLAGNRGGISLAEQ